MRGKSILKSFIVMLSFGMICLVGAQAHAMTLEEYMNNYAIPTAIYNTEITQNYLNEDTTEEQVRLPSGDFVLKQTDYVLPGVNGLDLKIGRIYQSGNAVKYNMRYGNTGTTYAEIIDTEWTNDNFWSYNEKNYDLGAGTRFSFPSLEIKGDYAYLHTETGATYALKNLDWVGLGQGEYVYKYQIDGYNLDDFEVHVNSLYPSYPEYVDEGDVTAAKYTLIQKDGTKMYFSGDIYDGSVRVPGVNYEGKLLAIKDRYGNMIKFRYREIPYTIDGTTKYKYLLTSIIDSLNRTTTISYTHDSSVNASNGDLGGKFQTVVSLPNGLRIVYNKNSFVYDTDSGASTRERLDQVYFVSDGTKTVSDLDSIEDDMRYRYGYEEREVKFRFFDYGEEYPTFTINGQSGQYNSGQNMVLMVDKLKNKAKKLEYETGWRLLGKLGRLYYHRVVNEKDIAVRTVNSSAADITDRFNGDIVSEHTYDYQGLPRHFGGLGLDFESGSDVGFYFGYGSQWQESGTEDSGYESDRCMKSRSNYNTTSGQMSVTTIRPAVTMFDYKVTGSGLADEKSKINVYIGSQLIISQEVYASDSWKQLDALTPEGKNDLKFEFIRPAGSTEVIYIDNVRVDSMATVTDTDKEGTIHKYMFNHEHMMLSHLTMGDDQITNESRKYDWRKQLSEITKTQSDADENGVYADASAPEIHSYTYNNVGDLMKYTAPDRTTTTLYTYDQNKFNQLTSKVVTSNGAEKERTEYTLDNFGNPTREKQFNTENGSAKNTIHDYQYDGKGNMIQKTSYLETSPSETYVMHYEYADTYANAYLTKKYGTVDNQQVQTIYEYDTDTGNLINEKRYRSSNEMDTTSYEYDFYKRNTKTTFADGTVKTNEYQSALGSDRFVRSTDQNGNKIRRVYDINDRLLGECYENDEAEQDEWNLKYEYNSKGSITKVTDANGNSVLTEYDSANRPVRKTNYDSTGTEKSYTTMDYQDTEGVGYEIMKDIKGISSGFYYNAIIKNDGSVWTWGRNEYGQLGNGTTDDLDTPTKVNGLPAIKQVACGKDFMYALAENGDVYSWGRNTEGHLALGTVSTMETTPHKIPSLSNIKQISAGNGHGMALKTDGTAYAWGWGARGQLGSGSTNNQSSPVRCGTLTGIKKVVCGYAQSYAVLENGSVYAWGNADSGCLGTGQTEQQNSPVQITSISNAVDIAAGHYSVAVVLDNGKVKTFGRNNYGQLGLTYSEDNRTFKTTPQDAKLPNDVVITKIAAGPYHYLMVDSDNNLITMGNNDFFQVDDGTALESTTTIRRVRGIKNVNEVSGGYYNSLALCDYDGGKAVWQFGRNYWDTPNEEQQFSMFQTILALPKAENQNRTRSVTETDEEGYRTISYFDVSNRMIAQDKSADNQNFNTTSYEYDYRGNKVKQTDPKGNVTVYTYDMLGRTSTVTDALSNVTKYSYNALGKTAQKEEPGNKLIRYTYDNMGRLTGEKTGDVSTIEQVYTLHSYQYDLSDNIILEEQSAKISDTQNIISLYKTYTYNNRNRLTTEKKYYDGENDRFYQTNYTYDNNGNLTKEVTGDEASTGIVRCYAYDRNNRVISKEEKAYYAQTSAQSEQERLRGNSKLEYIRDWNGNVTQEREYKNGTQYIPVSYTYDYRNNVIKKQEPNSIGTIKETNYEYDKRGKLIKKSFPREGNTVSEHYTYDGLGNLTQKTDPLGGISLYEYDENSNLVKEYDPRYSASKAQYIAYTYDALNRQNLKKVYDGSGETVISYREYDGRGNITLNCFGEGYNASNPSASIGDSSVYNAQDKVAQLISADSKEDNLITRTYLYDALGNVLENTDAYGNITQYTYNNDGTLNKVTYPDSTTEEYSYDGATGKLFRQVKNKAGGLTKLYYNLFGQPYKTEYPDGSSETMDYDMFLGLVYIAFDKRQRKTKYEYNASKKVKKESVLVDETETEYIYRETTYLYNEDNQVSSYEIKKVVVSKANENTVLSSVAITSQSTVRDANGRTTRIYGPDINTYYSYDAAGNKTKEEIQTEGTNYNVKRWEYDILGRISKEIVLVENSTVSNGGKSAALVSDSEYSDKYQASTAYTYHSSGKVKTQTSPYGEVTVNNYTGSGNLASTQLPNSGTVSYDYDANNNVIKQAMPNGEEILYTFDAMNRITAKNEPSNADSGRAVTNYTYDANGNLISESMPNQNGTAVYSYTYDSMDRRIQTKASLLDNQTVEAVQYDAMGNIIKRVDGNHFDQESGDIASSEGTEYTYTLDNRVKTETDVLGNTKYYEYDVMGNLTKLTDERGNATQYTYHYSFNQPTRIDYPDGGMDTFTYDLSGRVKTRTQKQSSNSSVSISYSYNGFNKVIRETDSDNHSKTYQYDLSGNLTRETDKRGNSILYEYTSTNKLSKKTTPIHSDVHMVEQSFYDSSDNLIRQTAGTGDELYEVTYTYTRGNLVKTVSDNEGRLTVNQYDHNGNVISTAQKRDDTSTSTTQYRYDAYNRKIQDVITPSNSAQSGSGTEVVTSYEYDLMGNLLSKTDPENGADNAYKTTYGYDGLNRLTAVTAKHNGADVTSTKTYDSVGNVISETDANGNSIAYTYDSMNRVLTKTQGGDTYTYTYDFAGNLLTKSDETGTFSYEYDSQNRLSVTKDAENTVINKKVYDENGNVTGEIDGKGYASGLSDSGRYKTEYSYTMNNMLETMKTPELENVSNQYSVRYRYDQFGRQKYVYDPDGNTTEYSYDKGGNLIGVTDAKGNVTSYEYDLANNLTKLTDANGNETGYEYLDYNLLWKTTDANGNTASYTYDKMGRMTSQTDRLGNVISYTYNNQNQITKNEVKKEGKTVSEPNSIVERTYDANGNMTGMQDASGTYVYSYDAKNRVTSVSRDGESYLSYSYDSRNNVTLVNGTAYGYNSRNQLSSVSKNGVVTNYTYDTNGNVREVRTGSLTTVYEYNRNNRVTRVENKAGTEVLEEYSYTYDYSGRMKTVTSNEETTTYTYNSIGQVSQVQYPNRTVQYVYDNAGNRIRSVEEYETSQNMSIGGVSENYIKVETDYEYSRVNTLLKETASVKDVAQEEIQRTISRYGYDANGNTRVVTKAKTEKANAEEPETESYGAYIEGGEVPEGLELIRYSYDGYNRLVKTEEAGGRTIEYSYRGDDLRAGKKVTSGETAKETEYVYDRGQVIRETTNGTAKEYAVGLQYIGAYEGGSSSYFMYNGRGDVTRVTGSSGTALSEYSYDIFGNAESQVGDSNSIRYAGEYYDRETEQYYLRARYYTPGNGRFLTEDSYGGDTYNPQTLNRYTYCTNDPVNLVDPSGHDGAPPDDSMWTKEQWDSYYDWAAEISGGSGSSNNSDKPVRTETGSEIDWFHATHPGESCGDPNCPYHGGYNYDPNNPQGPDWAYLEWQEKLKETEMTTGRSADGAYSTNIDNYSWSNNPTPDAYLFNQIYDKYQRTGDKQELLAFIQYYYNLMSKLLGSVRKGPDNVYQLLYSSAPENRFLYAGPKNMYDDYEFGFFDALNWLIQTGGNMNFVLLTRNTTDNELVANIQADIIGKFVSMWSAMQSASISVEMPNFFVGSTEYSGSSGLDIYDRIKKILHENKKSASMITGIYFGKEDPIISSWGELQGGNDARIQEARAFANSVHEKGLDLIWIPYHSDIQTLEDILDVAELNIFDAIMIQPGVYFSGAAANEEQQPTADIYTPWLNELKTSVQNYNQNAGRTKVGVEFEFDMGMVTGRMNTNDTNLTILNKATSETKRMYFKLYLSYFYDFIGSDIPVGIYSGGPNEQGYNNVFHNSNTHNVGNHKPYREGFVYEDFWPYNNQPYDSYLYPDRYNGNLIYDINRYLFNKKNPYDTGLGSFLYQ